MALAINSFYYNIIYLVVKRQLRRKSILPTMTALCYQAVGKQFIDTMHNFLDIILSNILYFWPFHLQIVFLAVADDFTHRDIKGIHLHSQFPHNHFTM